MKVKLVHQGDNVIPLVQCPCCGKQLHFFEYSNERGIPCINTTLIVEKFCYNCGTKVEV